MDQIDGKEIMLLLNDLCLLLNLTPPTHTEQCLIYAQLNKRDIFRKPTEFSRLAIQALAQARY